MRAHLRYLKYVLIHKLYVAFAGLAIRRVCGGDGSLVAWCWRLLVHDWTKFTPSEWTPYVRRFYGRSKEERVAERAAEIVEEQEAEIVRQVAAVARTNPDAVVSGHLDMAGVHRAAERYVATEDRAIEAAFNRAWLHHQHRNPHHWQHHILVLDDRGRQVVLTPPVAVVDEMVADWIGAGGKVLSWPSLAEVVGATISWYTKNRGAMLLREMPRQRVEFILWTLAAEYGLLAMAEAHLTEQGAPASAHVAAVVPSRR